MKKYTMDDFINNKIAVKAEGDNLKALLKACEKHGLEWRSGRKPTEFVPEKCEIVLCNYEKHEAKIISFFFPFDKEDEIKVKERGFKIVPFFAMDLGLEKHYQIIIDCEGDTTTAKMIVNGKEVKTAKAKRNPDDKFNVRIGAQFAFDRLWKERKAEKPAKQPKKQPGVFKVGDMVVCVAPTDCKPIIVGAHGTVVDTPVASRRVGVKFDKFIDGHECHDRSKCEFGFGWYCDKDTLRHE